MASQVDSYFDERCFCRLAISDPVLGDSGEWRVDSDSISALSILLISAPSLNKCSEFSEFVNSSFVDNIRKVSSCAGEPRAAPTGEEVVEEARPG